MHNIELGVLEFLNLTLRTGGLSGEFVPRNRAAVGQAAHLSVTACRPAGYRREVGVRLVYEDRPVRLVVRGRIDGLLEDEDGILVEEIKSTFLPLAALTNEHNPFHCAQLQLYHHFICASHPGARVAPVLTYVHPVTLEERSFRLEWTPDASRRFFEELAARLLRQLADRRDWQQKRNATLAHLRFPFDGLRPGQVELVTAVERAIENHHDLLAEAATGIGKTVGVLYPALRKLTGRAGYHRIFYLTAKSAGITAARNALALFRRQALHLRVLYLQAKSRCCPLVDGARPECDDLLCPYAEDFYRRAEPVVKRLLDETEEFTPELIAEVSEAEQLCPFELSLEISLHVDVIVCDYNYVFDPLVALKRFFAPGLPDDHLFLIDEAHNLLPRGREMFSATLDEETLRALAECSIVPGLASALHPVQAQFARWREEMELEGGQAMRVPELPADFPTWVNAVLDVLAEFLVLLPRGDTRTRLRELFFLLARFSRIVAELSPEHIPYVTGNRQGLCLRLACVHPGHLLRRRVERGTAAIFFSGTLSPREYFSTLLGARDGCAALALPSPFPRENRLYLHVPNVSTKYRAREETRPAVSRVILDTARARPGNYLAFFPSYAYMSAVWAEIMITRPADLAIHVQRPGMSLEQQAEFLRHVCADDGQSHLGLAVMGGLFGEAIDLPGEQLVGTLIVGPGLPGISAEQELIREYFEEAAEGTGYYHAYVVPGLVRVIQAAGRVFRTPDDRGVVVLMDDRFLESPFREILPPDWDADDEDFSTEEYQAVLAEFWGA